MTDNPPLLRVAIYDLDRTVLRTPTFTLFLLWAAWREAPWRLLLLPALAALMIGHALRLYGRDRFKPAAIRLMLGASIAPARAETLAAAFAAWRVPRDVPPGAEALGFDAIVASRHRRDDAGNWLPLLDGSNCYGEEKARRVRAWLAANAPDGTAHIRAYSDHLSDAPTFALAGEAWLIGRGDKYVRLAAKHGWRAADFEDAAVAEHR